ncbi:MAG: ATP-binding protein [Verrucomicrobiota bacterium]
MAPRPLWLTRPRRSPTSPALRERDERLEALVQLAGRLAHDFNNLLVPVLGYTALIKEEMPPDSVVLPYLNAMEKSARKTESAVAELLLAARSEREFKPGQVDFTELIARELSQWKNSLAPAAAITVKQALQPCSLVADDAQFQVVLRHLLGNVRYALATGGTVEVSLNPKNLTPKRAEELGVESPDGFELTIHDDGFGMSEEAARRAFEPFFTTRSKSCALGMGLALVHSIVRTHGGQVVLESRKDIGTTVRIWLPAGVDGDGAMRHSVNAELALEERAAPASAQALIVDEDPLFLEVLKSSLQRSGFEVWIAKDGKEALNLYNNLAANLGLVVWNLSMPELPGVDAAAQIRQTNPDVPIVLISSAGDENLDPVLDRISSLKLRLIKKPFTLKSFLETINESVIC